MRPFRLVAAAAGPLAAALVLGLAPPATAAPHRPAPVPGAPGIGDPLFPGLGNGGYDVTRYGIDMTYRDAHRVDAVTVVEARTTQALGRFDLDFDGNTVHSVTVDGRRAAWSRQGVELVVTPSRVLRKGARFTVRVTYTADPAGAHDCPTPPPLVGSAWFPTPDGGFVTAGQPNCMHTVFPSNDHPRDKASYRFTLTAPTAFTAVANGSLVRRARHGASTTWTYREDDPMATELVQIAIGDYTVLTRRGPHGVRMRDVVPTDLAATIGPKLTVEDEHLRWMEQRVGRYPFEEYGVLVAKLQIGFALETQTLSLFPDFAWGPLSTPAGVEPVQVHELAHQWFGDDVSPEKWADVWLNEGHATWYEGTYADEKGWEPFEARMRTAYARSDQWRAEYGPVASPRAETLFSDNVYDGGALVLYALRQKIGAARFARLERAWVHRYAGSAAGTPEFIALASRIAGRDLSGFLTAWLYGTTTPPMPGRPEWTVDPVGAPAAATLSTGALVRR